jgi:uncharacterized protein (UPF0332 family)
MNFNWLDYFTFATELIKDANQTGASFQEAKYRIIISRAYYAVLHEARLQLKKDQPTLIIPKRATHYFIIKQFLSSQDPARRELGSKLRRFKVIREKADYADTLANPDKVAQKALLTAQEILNLLATL